MGTSADDLRRAGGDDDEFYLIAQAWVEIEDYIEGLDGTLKGVMSEMRMKVADALYCTPPNLALGRSITAKAFLILTAYRS